MEIFDIIDENGNPTGKTVERSIAHAEGIRHALRISGSSAGKMEEQRSFFKKDPETRILFQENLILHLQATYRQGMNRWNQHCGN